MKERILPDFRKATHLAGVYCIEGEGGGGSVILRRFHDELSFRNEQTWTTKDRKRICQRLFGLRLVWPTCIFFASWSSMSGLKSEWAGNFQQSFFVCCAILMSHKNGETAVDGHNPALFWFISVSCCCFHVVQSALQNSIVYVAKSPFLLSPCESQDVCTVKAWLRGNSGGRRHFEYA